MYLCERDASKKHGNQINSHAAQEWKLQVTSKGTKSFFTF